MSDQNAARPHAGSADDEAVRAAEVVSDVAGAEGGTLPNDPLTGHSYDGIEEYDNPMPGWWKKVFWATVWFSIIYPAVIYSVPVDGSVLSSYERAKIANVRLQFAEVGELPPNGESVTRFLDQPQWLEVGEAIYTSNCVSCHGPEALGLIGPNLRDESYKNVRAIDDVIAVVSDGAANGAMPAWKTRLSPNELVMVSSYVASLRGTAVGRGKEPEGREIAPWPAPPPAAEVPADVDVDPPAEADPPVVD